MIENAFQCLVNAADRHFQETMDDDVQHGQKSEANIAKENGKLRLRRRVVWRKFLAELLMECHVFVVPIVLFPVVGWILPNEFHYAIPQLVRFQQQQLNDVEAHLSLAALLRTQCETECQSIEGEYIVRPDQGIHGVHSFLDVMILARCRHLEYQVIAQFPQMSR